MADKNSPQFPIYIPSRGRGDIPYTARELERLGVNYYIVIEEQEYEQYSSVIDKSKILVLPYGNLNVGAVPARNFIWEHSVANGFSHHWELDDNIRRFMRLNKNKRLEVSSGAIFKAAEDFSIRYTNLAISGFQYAMFAVTGGQYYIKSPFILNTRIYSCMLIRNDIPYRWRGEFNADTDLSIRAMKDGWCTVLFYAFLCDKLETMKLKGGNTDRYKGDGRKKMAEYLRNQHPDITRVDKRYGRYQHVVDYSGFQKNKLIRRKDISIQDGVNEYGMYVKKKDNLK